MIREREDDYISSGRDTYEDASDFARVGRMFSLGLLGGGAILAGVGHAFSDDPGRYYLGGAAFAAAALAIRVGVGIADRYIEKHNVFRE